MGTSLTLTGIEQVSFSFNVFFSSFFFTTFFLSRFEVSDLDYYFVLRIINCHAHRFGMRPIWLMTSKINRNWFFFEILNGFYVYFWKTIFKWIFWYLLLNSTFSQWLQFNSTNFFFIQPLQFKRTKTKSKQITIRIKMNANDTTTTTLLVRFYSMNAVRERERCLLIKCTN